MFHHQKSHAFQNHNPMLTYTFLSDPAPEQISQITALYCAEGWFTKEEAESPDLLARMIAGSHCFLVAVAEHEIIGMGRSLSDGVSDAYVQDVAVKHAYRSQGIGTKIVEAVVRRLETDGLKWIGLIAERCSHQFYEPLGFEEMPNSTPMIKIP